MILKEEAAQNSKSSFKLHQRVTKVEDQDKSKSIVKHPNTK